MHRAVSQLRAKGSLKWTFHPEDVLAAWVAEMDFGLAPPIGKALHEAVDRADTGYHSPAAERDCAEAASGFWRERLAWNVEPERVFFAPDVVEGIRRAIVELTTPGSSVILHSPIYHPFFSMVERAGRSAVEVPSTPGPDGRYLLDLAGIEQAFSKGAGSIVLCNPWNPTGRCLTQTEVSRVVEIARNHGRRVIADEVHAPLTRVGQVHFVAEKLDPETVITVTSASKAWNVAGLKCAQVVLSRPDEIARWRERFHMGWIGVSQLGLIANRAAYAEGSPWLDEIVNRLDQNRALLEVAMAELLPSVPFSPVDATYLAWLDFSAHGLLDPADYLLGTAKVALAAGIPFGTGGEGHARLNFATAPEILTEIIERIASVLPEVDQQKQQDEPAQ